MSLDIHRVERAIGKAALALHHGPTRVDADAYPWLVRLGILQRLPGSWPVPDEITTLPWGHEALIAPAPHKPRGIDGPWPQEPILHPDFPPAVLKVGRADIEDHVRTNVTRFLGQIMLMTPKAAWRARRGPRIQPVSDDAFESILTQTAFAQFLLPIVAPQERDAFADDLKAHPDALFATMDFSGFAEFRPLPGVYSAPTVVLLRQRSELDWAVVAIRCGQYVFHPDDGARWELAKYFVLQGAQFQLIHIVHPRLHFPLDAVNALTRSLLPENHRLKCLLDPHFRYTLGLHKAVIHHQRGALHNNQRELGVGFTFETSSMHEGVALGMRGRGDAAYQPYMFNGVHIGTHTAYGRYRQAWYHHVLDFTRKIVATFELGDVDITRWADAISEWVPGFPDGTAIWRDDVLARTLATIISTLSVFHTADHHSYSKIPLTYLPWRLRHRPPDNSGPKALDLKSLILPEDHFRAILMHAMYFRPVIRSRLSCAKYSFGLPAARDAAAEFLDGMAALDRTWREYGFATSDEIAASIQF
jgi:hypothetical protein